MKQNEWQKRNEAFRNYIKWTYDKGHSIEAVILLYQGVYTLMYFVFMAIASRMRIVLNQTDDGTTPAGRKSSGIPDYHFRSLAHILYEMGALDSNLHCDTVKLANFRDEMMHRFFSSKLNQSRFGKAYQSGMEVFDRLSGIAERYPNNLDEAIRPITQPRLLAELLSEDPQGKDS